MVYHNVRIVSQTLLVSYWYEPDQGSTEAFSCATIVRKLKTIICARGIFFFFSLYSIIIFIFYFVCVCVFFGDIFVREVNKHATFYRQRIKYNTNIGHKSTPLFSYTIIVLLLLFFIIITYLYQRRLCYWDTNKQHTCT